MPLRRVLAYVLRGSAGKLHAWANALYGPPAPQPTPRELAHAAWLAADGDKTLRLDYALNRDSVVFDVGGFEGQWASDIFAKYLCRIHVFEPVPHFAERIVRRFAANDRVKVHACALGASPGRINMSVQGDESSVHLKGQDVTVDAVTPESAFESEGIGELALMKVNIEGGEYDLLEHLIDTGLIRRIQQLQIQFHDFVPGAESRMRIIQSRLIETHQPTYRYHFIWENWRRKDLT